MRNQARLLLFSGIPDQDPTVVVATSSAADVFNCMLS